VNKSQETAALAKITHPRAQMGYPQVCSKDSQKPVSGKDFYLVVFLIFCEVDDYVSVPHNAALSFPWTSPMSFDLWAYRNSSSNGQHLMALMP